MCVRQNGFCFGKSPHGIPNSSDLIRVETCSWFIEDQDIGIMQKSLTHADPLFKPFDSLLIGL